MVDAARLKQAQLDLERFYGLMKQLDEGIGGKRVLGSCAGAMSWPTRGVYFFFEPGEVRVSQPAVLRVVRVGTHAVSNASKSTLWRRLRQHRGGTDQGGNHRGSIFRLHTGAAIIARDKLELAYSNWGIKQSAGKSVRTAEQPMEATVSNYLGKMSILWVNVDDLPSKHSQRGLIERNAIALLSGELAPADTPSANWLGRHSTESRIRGSGLWNLNYVHDTYDPAFLDVLEKCVQATILFHRPPGHGLPLNKGNDTMLSSLPATGP